MSFALQKKVLGRKMVGRCVSQTARNRSKPHCSFFKAIGGSFAGTGATGANQVAIPNGRKLTPGTYLLTMTATDVAGNKATQTATFTVKKKKKKKRK